MKNEYIEYNNKRVPVEYFRAFVYNEFHDKKLVESADEFKNALASGEWFELPPPFKRKMRKKAVKHADSSTISDASLSTD